jgi:hypothetical protein
MKLNAFSNTQNVIFSFVDFIYKNESLLSLNCLLTKQTLIKKFSNEVT